MHSVAGIPVSSGACFQCRQCGACCRVEGYVRLSDEDVRRLSAELGLDTYTFTERYTRLTRERDCLALQERADGACVFLSPAGTCTVNRAKPRQCREFPASWRFRDAERICRGLQADTMSPREKAAPQ